MKLKKFNEYIKEDTSSVYDIEHPFTGDGDNMTTQGDESQEDGAQGECAPVSEIECEKPMFNTEGEAIDIKGELAKIDVVVLQKIANGEVDAIIIAQDILNGLSDDVEDGEEDMDFHDEDDMDGDTDLGGEGDYIDYDDHTMPLEEKLKFSNFRKRK